MKVTQYVVRRDGSGRIGRIVAVKKHDHGHCDRAGSRYAVRVYWLKNGHRSACSGAQLKVLCPTCAGEDADFADYQLERERQFCEVCQLKPEIATKLRERP